MMRSLFSGVAGLRTHQTRMDVIGNNIANVNTVAYKSSSMTFQDLLYQTTQNASGANAATGRAGINAKQIGLGVATGSISTAIATGGSNEQTGNPFDIKINGSSFFVVNDGNNQYFTRAGAFNVDAEGTLCMSSNGYNVMGYRTTEDALGNTVIDTSQLRTLPIMSETNQVSDPMMTERAYVNGIIDQNDDSLDTDKGKIVTFAFYDNLGYSYTAQFSIKPVTTGTAPNIVKTPHQYTMTMTDIFNSEGESIMKDNTGKEMTAAAKQTALASAIQPQTLVFSEATGAFVSSSGKTIDTETKRCDVEINLSALGAYNKTFAATDIKSNVVENATGQHIMMDLAQIKDIDNNGTSTVNGGRGTVESTEGAGWKVGELSSISISVDGRITGAYTNGQTKLLGQIATASFANASGLEKSGDNLYSQTANSGEAIIGDITADGGSMNTGNLEMSNVDLSQEFTTMITTQRGFQANSRVITVSDTLLEELVNLKR
ncbi:MAG: flagellar hook-basal body complex protein [Lachnospiraceae bacterium]|nr:flagellar hook-basal body complex protein [Lachnospiraceae bacterium]